MFGFIKNLFNGILSFLTGLFGGKKAQEKLPSSGANKAKNRKPSGYFMELAEEVGAKPADTQKTTSSTTVKTPEPVAASPVEKSQEKANTNGQGAKVELVQTAQGVKAEPVKPTKSPLADTNGQKPTDPTFAPKYLNPTSNSSNSRRRPGPNMNPFLDMARQVNNPG
jgi:hypothetical protein